MPRPKLRVNWDKFPPYEMMIMEISCNDNNNPEYIGTALSGTDLSDSAWNIKKITYDNNSNPIRTRFADGSARFDKAWNDRASYSY